MTEKEAYIAFSVFPGIGPVRFRLLVDYFGNARNAWGATRQKLEAIHLGAKLIEKFIDFRNTFDLSDYFYQLDQHHVHTLPLNDPRYPKLLKEIPDPPFVLYVRSKPGMEKIDMDRTVAIVGTRQATPYGRDITERITNDLADAGCTIISGMAYGIDAVAHRTTMRMHGKTIAVLGCGVDIIAPPINADIYHALTDDGCGAVVSEMPLGLRPGKGLFPARNRIISGLSLGVVVTEGAHDSGALITARYAAEQGRDVFAVPGPVTSRFSKGPSILIKNGAILAESGADILTALGIRTQKKKGRIDKARLTTDEEKRIISALEKGGRHVDELVRESGIPGPMVFSTLTVLEMKRIIKDVGGKIYEIL